MHWVRLGDYITRIDDKNSDNAVKIVKSVSVTKEFKDTNAKVDKDNLKGYKIVYPNHLSFVQTTGNEKCLCIAVNHFGYPIVVTSVNEVFKVNEQFINPDFLMLYFRRKEMDRYARFHSWGSARETFTWDDMCNVKFPLIPINEQERVLNVWWGLRKVKEENEMIAKPLFSLCQSKVQDIRRNYPLLPLGDFIKRVDERNRDNKIKSVKGMSVSKEYREPTSKVNREELSTYKIVRYNQFGFIQTTNNEKCLVAVLSKFREPIVISSVNEVFEIQDTTKLYPDYLQIWFNRKETDRYARFNSWGSAREIFSFEEMQRFKVPVPPIDIQHAIADIFNCAQEAKRLSDNADVLSRDICSALVQIAINS